MYMYWKENMLIVADFGLREYATGEHRVKLLKA
jgi:hypothetical protein